MMPWSRKRAGFARLRGDQSAKRIADLERQVAELTDTNRWLAGERLRFIDQRQDAHRALSLVVHAAGGRVEVTRWHVLEMEAASYCVDTIFVAEKNAQVFTTPAPQ